MRNSRGYTLLREGHPEDALREFEAVKTGDPDYVATYFQLGQLYQKLGKTHEAEKTFRTGITVAAKAGDDHAIFQPWVAKKRHAERRNHATWRGPLREASPPWCTMRTCGT